MAGSIVQQSASQSFNNVGSGAQNFSMPANFTAGNSAVVEIACYQAAANRVSAVTVNGVSASLLYREAGASFACVEVWLARNLTGGSASVSVTLPSGSGYYVNACCVETSALTSAADRTATANSSGTSITFSTGSATTSADELVVSCWRDDTGVVNTVNPSAQSPLTQGYYQSDGITNLGGASGHKVVTSTGVQTATFTNSPSTLRYGIIVTIPFSSTTTLTGSAATTASGTLTKLLALALAGSAATSAAGTVSPTIGVSVGLTGSSATASAGNVTASGNISVGLTGSAATTAQGSLGLAKGLALAGTAAQSYANGFEPGGGLGSSTLLGIYDGEGVSPEVTSPITTNGAGSSFIYFDGGLTANSATPVDSKGNSLTQVGTTAFYTGYSNVYNFRLWKKDNGVGGTNHAVSKTQGSSAVAEIVMGFIEAMYAPKLSAFTQDYPQSGSANTSTPVHVNGPATLVAVWTGDSSSLTNSATPGNGFSTFLDWTSWTPGKTSVQTVVASKDVTAAGDYGITWTESPTQGAILFLLAFEHDTGSAGVSIAVPLSGSAATSAAGSVSVPSSVAIAGSSATASPGNVGASKALALAGSAADGIAGSLVVGAGAALGSQVATTAAGSVAPSIALALSGSSATAGAGTVMPATGSGVVLSGSAAASAVGDVGIAFAVPLTGSQAQTAAGTIPMGGGVPHLASITVSNIGTACTTTATNTGTKCTITATDLN